MSMKKGIAFLVTLLILVCVGSAVWAASSTTPTMNKVIAYKEGSADQAPYTKLSGQNRTIYYEGTGYPSVLSGWDIGVTAFKQEGDEYIAIKNIPIPPISSTNHCTCINGFLKGDFTILPQDWAALPQEVVRIEVLMKGMDSPAVFEVDRTVPSVSLENSFLPDSGSEIRGKFVASMKADEDIHLWMLGKDTGSTQDYAIKAQSSGFSNPASLIIDPSLFRATTPADLKFVGKDEAALEYSTEVTGISFKRYADPITSRDAARKISVNAGNPVYEIWVPINNGQQLIGQGNCKLGINGKVVYLNTYYTPQTPGDFKTSVSSDGKWEILTVLKTTDVDSGVAIDVYSWCSADKVMVGVNNDAADQAYDVYFGADDAAGPVLVQALVDSDNNQTMMLFSEALDKSAVLDPNDIEVKRNGSDWARYTEKKAVYSTTNERAIILPEKLTTDDKVRVGYYSCTDIRDKKGNKVVLSEVPVLIGRKVTSVQVTGVGNNRTEIKLEFNDLMDIASLKHGDYYTVSATAGLLDSSISKDTNNDGILDTVKPEALSFEDISDKAIRVVVNGRITDTSASGLPKVEISEAGMQNIKGEKDELLVSNNKGVASEDKVGPYLVSASYNRNPSGKQLVEDKVENHVLILNFSEPIKCSALWYPGGDFTGVTGNNNSLNLTKASFVQETGYSSRIDIKMGEDSTPLPEGNATIWVLRTEDIRDQAGNTASYNPHVTIEDATLPWIVSVETADTDNGGIGNGYIDQLIVTWNESITQYFDYPEGVVKVPGYSLYSPQTSSTNNPSGIETLIVYLQEKPSPDTGAHPGLVLNLSDVNYFKDAHDNVVGSKLEISSASVKDGARPVPLWAEYVDNGQGSYTFRVKYSEAIDPNVWRDANNDASRDLGLFSNAQCTTSLGNVVGKYVVHECSSDSTILSFKATIFGGLSGDVYVAPVAEAYPNGVFDQSKNYVASAATMQAKNYAFADDLKAKEHQELSGVTGVVPDHDPLTSAGAMILHGKVIGLDGEPVAPANTNGDYKWRIYAYSLKNLYRFSHLYDPNGTPVEGRYYDDKPTMYATNDQVEAILAPANNLGGVCYGSAYIDPNDGTYTMYVFGDMSGSGLGDGFRSGEAIYLVVETPVNFAAGDQHKYLVTNGCKADSDFYVEWKDLDYKVHDIDLRRYEEIPLTKGWNLVSFSTLKRYILGDGKVSGTALQVNVGGSWQDIPANTMVRTTAIDPVIPSLYNQWSKIFTVNPAHDDWVTALRVTEPASANQLDFGSGVEFFSVGYGYWINVPTVRNAKLVVLGDVIKDGSNYRLPITVGSYGGWNLIGYWGDKVSYINLPGNAVFSSVFSKETSSYNQVTSIIRDAFASFGNKLAGIRTFYLNSQGTGKIIKAWYPANPATGQPEFNEISYVGPGYGYWVKITAPCDVRW